MSDTIEEVDQSKRNFLKLLGGIGAAAVLGAGGYKFLAKGESERSSWDGREKKIIEQSKKYVDDFHVPVKTDGEGWVYVDSVNKNSDGSYAYDMTNPLDVELAYAEYLRNNDGGLAAEIFSSRSMDIAINTHDGREKAIKEFTKYASHLQPERFRVEYLGEYSGEVPDKRMLTIHPVYDLGPDGYSPTQHILVKENGLWKIDQIKGII